MSRPRSQPAPSMTRRRVLAIGLSGIVTGLLVLALSVFFLFIPWQEPNGVGGVMVPLAIAIPILALGVAALLPLRFGDNPQTAAIQARAWIALATVAAPIIVAGIIRDRSPWSALAALPVIVDGALFRSGLALRRAAREHLRDTLPPTRTMQTPPT